MSLAEDNAKEEIKEIVEKCIKCGLCKSLCPVFKVLREEFVSPRGKVGILDNAHYEKMVYDCTLCKACEKKCPLSLKLCTAFVKTRQILVEQKKDLPVNKEMLKNVQKTGNIYGIKQEVEEE